MSKVIVITGASSGIGEASAALLAADGHKLVLGARRQDKLQAVAARVEEAGGQVAYAVTDVRQNAEVAALAQLTLDRFGRIDVWINNAGIMPQAPFMAGTVDEWDSAIDINIKGVIYGINAALPQMVAQKSGQIINVASVEGHHSHVGGGVYSGTKYAVRAISDSLREEMAQLEGHLRCTVISPGAVTTELLESVADDGIKERYEDFYATHGIPADRVATTIKQAIDLPEDTAWNEVVMRPIKQVL
ncbi:SDR family oxidoreductase [Streptococcus loxodontisalivarius]|uniref:NADP-dependent 3-hydroxy acid dehydrogenase YdfG n=1 Tax=Streptococcus loxodontisalivarius TaxID=1349415 RepID=A0ABS2PQY6_9STRE|nr:SDR family oxidoreductase [Streptococcus loxodontisalivarius]MBM7642459.1 NADP-dependent 3-hydroxy acid dehydrogenase YdfG [Streptococcus loxodontisalivarius]